MNDEKNGGTDAPVPVGASVPTEQSATTTPTTTTLYPVRVRINPEDRLIAAKAGLPTAPEVRLPLTAPAVKGIDDDGYLVMDLPYTTDGTYLNPGPKMYTHIALRAAYRSHNPVMAYETMYEQVQTEAERREAEQTRWEATKTAQAEKVVRILGYGKVSQYGVYVEPLQETVRVTTDENDALRPTVDIVSYIQRRMVEVEEERKRREAQEAEAKAAREAVVREREEWIKAHGSPALKKRVERGYDCKRRYIEERLKLELPGWVARQWDDMPDLGESRNRSDPSDGALDAELQAEAAGYKARTYWVVYERDDEGEKVEREETMIEDYHGHEVYRVGSS